MSKLSYKVWGAVLCLFFGHASASFAGVRCSAVLSTSETGSVIDLLARKTSLYTTLFSYESAGADVLSSAREIDRINGNQFIFQILEKRIQDARRFGLDERREVYLALFEDLANSEDRSVINPLLHQIRWRIRHSPVSDSDGVDFLYQQVKLLLELNKKWQNELRGQPLESLLRILDRTTREDLTNKNTDAIEYALLPLFDSEQLTPSQQVQIGRMSYRLLNHVSFKTRSSVLSTLGIRNRSDLIRDAIRGTAIRSEYINEIRNSALKYTQPEDFDDSEVRGHAEAYIRNNPSADLSETLRLRLESHRYLEEERRNPPRPLTPEELAEVEREMETILNGLLGDRPN